MTRHRPARAVEDADVESSPARYQVRACRLCTRRKVRCNKQLPCRYCLEHDAECIPSGMNNRKRRKRKTDSVLEQSHSSSPVMTRTIWVTDDLGVSHHPASRFRRLSDPRDEFLHLQALLEASERPCEALAARDGDRDPPSQDATDLGCRSVFMGRWYDSVFASDGQELLIFDDHCPGQALTSFTARQVFMLWSVYHSRVHPLIHLLDKFSVSEKLLRHGDNVSGASVMDQGLIFAVMTLALSAMDWQDAPLYFDGRDYQSVVADAQRSTRTALCRLQIWKTYRWEALQVLVIYLSGLHRFVDPRLLSVHVGMADRAARRMGLHREDTSPSTTPAIKNMKRRIWWELVVLDQRCNEKFGAGVTVLGDASQVSLPSTGEIGMHEPRTSPFVVVKLEVCNFYSRLRAQLGTSVGRAEISSWNLRLAAKLAEFDSLEQLLNERLATFASPDPEPTYRLARLCVRLHMSRMRMLAHLQDNNAKHQLAILKQAMLTIEAENEWRRWTMYEPYHWFMSANLPLLAYIFALSIVRKLPPSSEVQRAWSDLQCVPWLTLGLRGRLDMTDQAPAVIGDSGALLGPLLLKAWDAGNHFGIEEPECVDLIRQHIHRMTGSGIPQPHTNESTASLASTVGPLVPDVDDMMFSQFPQDWWENYLDIDAMLA